jgi:H+/Cl- antiporter ClcA
MPETVRGLGFYEVAATIIPVLLLVIVVEWGVSDIWKYVPKRLRFVVFLACAISGLAEWRALRVLQTEHVAFLDPWVVWTLLAALATGVIAGATGNPFAPTVRLSDLRDELNELEARLDATMRRSRNPP